MEIVFTLGLSFFRFGISSCQIIQEEKKKEHSFYVWGGLVSISVGIIGLIDHGAQKRQMSRCIIASSEAERNNKEKEFRLRDKRRNRKMFIRRAFLFSLLAFSSSTEHILIMIAFQRASQIPTYSSSQ